MNQEHLNSSSTATGEEHTGSSPRRTDRTLSPATRTVRASLESDEQHGAVVPPLHLSSTFTFEEFGRPRTYDYTRSGNPTRDQLAGALADLEGGAGCTVTSSGMAAITAAVHLFEPGSTVLAPCDCYGGTHRLLSRLHERGQIVVRFVDLKNLGRVEEELRAGARALWVESPSNPLLRIADLHELATLSRRYEALLCVDNTFLSPVLQRPIEFGADVVVHSTTKYLNGHSDVVGGAVIARTNELAGRVAEWANTLGLTGSPFDSYLTLRGLRTLQARLRLHESNAIRVARTLERHPAVAEVLHPSLESHPDHALARRQQDGFGAMISLRLEGGTDAVRTLVENLCCFSLAESLGGVESLVAHPATMTHASMPKEARDAAGICDRLVRLSVGIEDAEDLCADLERALDLIARRPTKARSTRVQSNKTRPLKVKTTSAEPPKAEALQLAG
ncbi:MAG: cystathionine gamma-synthase [Acidobacteriota bacterium]